MASSAVGDDGGAHGHAGIVLGLVIVVGAAAFPGLGVQRVERRLGLAVRELLCGHLLGKDRAAVDGDRRGLAVEA